MDCSQADGNARAEHQRQGCTTTSMRSGARVDAFNRALPEEASSVGTRTSGSSLLVRSPSGVAVPSRNPGRAAVSSASPSTSMPASNTHSMRCCHPPSPTPKGGSV
eukprot:scaffold47154_cov19-Tisochrysis_lutea.AAC.1